MARLPLSARRVLEIGCGAGALARAYLERNPAAQYVGVELSEGATREAAGIAHRVIAGDIEQTQVRVALDRMRGDAGFDVLVFGDVLEHLRDPWRLLAELRGYMVPGGVCVACIPNVAHWSVVQQQINGRWDYAEAGLLDRTHLRFFTLETAIELFRAAGWTVLDAKPRILWPDKTEAALRAFAPLAETLGLTHEKMRRDLAAFQWIVRAVNGPVTVPLSVAALGLNKVAGVTDARVDHPMAALSTLPTVRAVWGAGGLSVPPDWPPGVFVLHRQFMNDARFNAHIEDLVIKGWLIVADMDDDPHHWKEFVETDFRAYRGVHAVTVSTEPLAEMVRQWNPNVEVFSNAILELPEVPEAAARQGKRIRIFFGALNRGLDWAGLSSALTEAAQTLADVAEFVVVHDRAFFDAMPEAIAKEFHPTLPHDQYMAVLATCDVALLPLNDIPFNRLKSDLKFIECCAAGVVPICSPVVYGERAEHREIGVFAASADEWRQSLLRLCKDAAEIGRRRALGLAYVKRERMHCHQVAAREAWYRSLRDQREILEAQRQQRFKALA